MTTRLGVGGTHVNGINNNSQLVGYYIDSSGNRHGYLYSGGTFTTINDPSGVNGTADLGINNTGPIILSAQTNGTSSYDLFDLANTVVLSASINGTVLTVDTSGGVQTYTVIGQLGATPGTNVDIPFVSDGSGGTNLHLTPDGSVFATPGGLVFDLSGPIGAGTRSYTFEPAATYELTSATITGAGGYGLNVVTADPNNSDALTVQMDLSSSISVSGSNFNGLNLETGGANIFVNTAGSIIASGSGGYGIDASVQSGNGNITVNDTAPSITGAQSAIGVFQDSGGTGDLSVALGSNVALNGTAFYGIQANSLGTGSISITTSAGDTINSASAGINVLNQDATIPASDLSSITVTAYGTITSGSTLENGGYAPAGIAAGYAGSNSTPDLNIFGNITVNDGANITASAGYGIKAYNYGNGNITVNVLAGASVTGVLDGITATQTGGGIGNVAVNVASGATVTGQTGISAQVTGSGTLTITNYGTIITTAATGTGISATGNGSFTINNYGTINPTVTSTTGGATTGSVASGGTAFLNDYGIMNSAISQTIGGNTGRTATLTVSGSSAQFNIAGTANGMTVGNTGVGFMNVEAGGIFTSGFLTIAQGVGGQADTLDVNDATLDVTGSLTIGNSGNATATFENGASVTATGGLFVANNAGSTASVTITGAGTTVTTSSLTFGAGTTNSLSIANGGYFDVTGSVAGGGSITIQPSGTFAIGSAITQTLNFSGTGSTLDLVGILAKSAVINGSTLTVTETNNSTLTYSIAGSLAGNAFTLASDGKGGTDLTLEPIGYLWTTIGNLINAPGQHLYIPHDSGNGNADAAMFLVGSTPSASYNSAGPDNVTENVALGDPFFLPYDAGFQPIDSGPLVDIPAHNKIIFPNLTASTTEGIAVYETDVLPLANPPTPVLNLAIITYPNGDNGTPNFQTLSTILEPGAGTIETLDVAATGSPMTSYAVAWDLYNATAQTFNIYLATFNPSTNNPIITESIFNQTGFTSPSSEAWDLKSAGALKTDNQAVSYGLVMPQTNAGIEDVIFTAYMASGTSAPGVSFTIAPNLSHFATGATNQIINPDLPAQSVLQYTPNAVSGSGFSVAWSEQVNDSNGTHYQVEFAIFKPNFENASGVEQAGSLVTTSPVVFQVADAQNVRVGDYTAPDGTSHEFLAYGDATSTTVIEFDQSGNEIASITDPSPTGKVFTGLDVSSDGVISLGYASGGSQYAVDVYDFRQTGLANPTLSTTESNYVRGTEYTDLVTGATGVDNFYYYVGENTASQSNHGGPSDTFNGGSGALWGEAVFGDARSDYSIVANSGGTFTITYTNSADLHSGSLTVDANVQALAFNPSQDPSPISSNTILPITAGETLTLLHPSSFTLDISGLSASNVLELEGFGSKAGDTFQTSTSLSGSNTILTVTDLTQGTHEFVTLVGNYTSSTWTVTSDGSGGANVVDPPATAVTIAEGVTLDINATSSETVTYNGGTGSLVLDQPNTFSGHIAGFTGTAPDPAHSDTIDLVGINYNSAQFSETYDASNGVLKVTDGSTSASLTFDNFNGTLDFASDGNGGTLITDPPKTSSVDNSSTPATQTDIRWGGGPAANGHYPGSNQESESLGALQNDNFVFRPNIGGEFKTDLGQHIENNGLFNHPDNQTSQQAEAHDFAEAYHDPVFEPGHYDNIGMAPTDLLHIVQAGHLLH